MHSDREDRAGLRVGHNGAGAAEGGSGGAGLPQIAGVHPADFTIREDGVVRFNPELARREAEVATAL
jgi:hypothetical protein